MKSVGEGRGRGCWKVPWQEEEEGRSEAPQSKPAIEPHPVSRIGCPGPPCERVSRLLGLLSRLTRLHHRGGEQECPGRAELTEPGFPVERHQAYSTFASGNRPVPGPGDAAPCCTATQAGVCCPCPPASGRRACGAGGRGVAVAFTPLTRDLSSLGEPGRTYDPGIRSAN